MLGGRLGVRGNCINGAIGAVTGSVAGDKKLEVERRRWRDSQVGEWNSQLDPVAGRISDMGSAGGNLESAPVDGGAGPIATIPLAELGESVVDISVSRLRTEEIPANEDVGQDNVGRGVHGGADVVERARVGIGDGIAPRIAGASRTRNIAGGINRQSDLAGGGGKDVAGQRDVD